MQAQTPFYSEETAPEQVKGKAETHEPKIEVPEKVIAGQPFTVRIRVGPHPNTDSHSIRWIEVFFYEEGRTFNPIHIASIQLAPTIAEPDITLTVKVGKSGVLYVLAYCNLHGVWEAKAKITVEAGKEQ
ncbi:MAG TPA: desulfoferrodoxin [Pyrodictium sp.]|nr:desulfoferrodoxin [Pyrodictium sp.]